MSLPVDVAVVGGGSAGCAVAARLSEDPARRVLLLEAGPAWRAADAPPEIHLRRYGPAVDIEHLSQFHWTNRYVIARDGREPRQYLSGRGLGGSSTINTQIALRPPLDEFNSWEKLGAKGWSASVAADLFARMEDDRDFRESPGHGRSGPISIERAPRESWSAFDLAFLDAAVKLGYEEVLDVNTAAPDCVAPVPYSRAGDCRVTSNHGYLEPARRRPNLEIVGDALVDRVLIDGQLRAAGVRWRATEGWVDTPAGEIVLCAGSIGSAGILMRSGLGAPGDLRALGIPPVLDLPVGLSAQDHPDFAVSVDWRDEEDGDRLPAAVLLRCTSSLAGTTAGDVVLIPLHPAEVGGTTFPACVAVWGFEAASRGVVRLVSAEPDAAPSIHLRILSEEEDVKRMCWGVRLACDILAQPSFRALGSRSVKIGDREVDPLNVGAFRGDTLTRLVLEHVGTHASLASTCRMGDEDNPLAVTDPHGRVYGIERLRVADLSIAPKCPRANANLTAILIGERVAGLLISS